MSQESKNKKFESQKFILISDANQMPDELKRELQKPLPGKVEILSTTVNPVHGQITPGDRFDIKIQQSQTFPKTGNTTNSWELFKRHMQELHHINYPEIMDYQFVVQKEPEKGDKPIQCFVFLRPRSFLKHRLSVATKEDLSFLIYNVQISNLVKNRLNVLLNFRSKLFMNEYAKGDLKFQVLIHDLPSVNRMQFVLSQSSSKYHPLVRQNNFGQSIVFNNDRLHQKFSFFHSLTSHKFYQLPPTQTDFPYQHLLSERGFYGCAFQKKFVNSNLQKFGCSLQLGETHKDTQLSTYLRSYFRGKLNLKYFDLLCTSKISQSIHIGNAEQIGKSFTIPGFSSSAPSVAGKNNFLLHSFLENSNFLALENLLIANFMPFVHLSSSFGLNCFQFAGPKKANAPSDLINQQIQPRISLGFGFCARFGEVTAYLTYNCFHYSKFSDKLNYFEIYIDRK